MTYTVYTYMYAQFLPTFSRCQIAPPNWHATFQKVPLSGECRENVGRKVSQSRNATPNFFCDDLNEFLALLIAAQASRARQRCADGRARHQCRGGGQDG